MIEPLPEFAHVGQHGLGGEELRPDVDGLHPVPIVGRDVLDPVPVVVAGVVDQHGDRPEVLAHRLDRRLQGRDVGEIAGEEQRRLAVRLEARAESRSPASRWMSTKATRAPCAAKARTISAPMPEAPPVMKTTRPARLG